MLPTTIDRREMELCIALEEVDLRKGAGQPKLVPFKRPFPPELLVVILSHLPTTSLPAWLRVSKDWHDVAGSILYKEVCIRMGVTGQAFFLGADADGSSTESKKKEAQQDTKKNGTDKSQKKNRKQLLLERVQSITIMGHSCPSRSEPRLVLKETAKMMTKLERVILVPEANTVTMSTLCERTRYPTCPIVNGLQCRSVTIHNMRSESHGDDPLQLLTPILTKVRHATLIIPPTTYYFGPRERYGPWISCARPSHIVLRTRRLESVRLIIGYSPRDMAADQRYRSTFTTIELILNFLAAFIDLNPTKFEIYIFNDFNETFNLVDFREQLEQKVEDLYRKRMDKWEVVPDSEMPQPQRTDWSADDQVFGLSEYFAIPNLRDELNVWWMNEWRRELYARQYKDQLQVRWQEQLQSTLRDPAVYTQEWVNDQLSLRS